VYFADMDTPRVNAWVVFDFSTLPNEYHSSYPFREGINYIFMGEIPNMPGHCIILDPHTGRGKFHTGYHTENFREAREDEL
jgi:hypothetical protein